MSAPIHPTDSIPQRIAKLLPAEMTAALLAINSALTLTTLPEDTVVYVGLLIGIVSPVYFWLVLGTKNILHIVFLVASYLILFTTIASVELWNFFPSQLIAIAAASSYLAPIWVFLITPIVAMLPGAVDLTSKGDAATAYL